MARWIAFNGALAAQLAAGAAVPDALDVACTAGALAATIPGGAASLPTPAAVSASTRG